MGPRKPKKPEQTTVVLSGLPKTLNADVLLGLLDEHFACTYDYFYLPMDMERFESWGLAYINFRSHETAVECQRYFTGMDRWPGRHYSERACRAQWSSIQGYDTNIEKQQQADWVNQNVPEDCKPMVFDENGIRLPTMDVFPHSLDNKGWSAKSDTVGWTDEWYGTSSNGQQSDRHGGWPEWRKHEWKTEWSDWSEKTRDNVWGQWQTEWDASENVELPSLTEELDPATEIAVETKAAELVDSTVQGSGSLDLSILTVTPPTSLTSSISLGQARYACPTCKACFAKWSACQHHILSEAKCRVQLQGLQEVCKQQAAEIDSLEPFQDTAIVTEVRRFQ